ncbi:hypothetical protein O6H91_12G038900 [Diphasiastrum complanatum]|nr:hypothetical protein O6H91_12G038900 [Diphasiastrum complanatum]KAJ7535567.1 hypothetical protein O6H91_12G038900 [Diphasiastrum complanatum]KAJ7535569.1 hypothetical protein O6H91_12G038900 [Diphasiastrum complanatum]KAJ7535570.1 hypothetical protein O6H91_12G038900 [Diphasiastrum complanatum]
MHLQPPVPQHWVPDERDNFISWLRSEFAAANAIIDAFCQHLRIIGNSGEYDLVFACLQQRRYNWNVILHLQQYFSVSEVMLALQQVAQKKHQARTADLLPTYTEVETIDLNSNGMISVRAQKEGSLNKMDAEQIILKNRASDRLEGLKDDSEKGKNQLGNNEREELLKKHPSVTQGLLEYKVTENGAVQNKQLHLQGTSSSPPLASHAHGQKNSEWRKRNSQNRFGLTSKKREGYISKCSIDSKFYSNAEEDARFAAMKMSSKFSCHEDFEGQLINVVEGMELYENIFNNEERSQLALLVADWDSAGKTTGGGNKEDIADVTPAPLQAIIDRLVRWNITSYNKRPDSYKITILEKGESAIADISVMDLEQPLFLISLLSECSVVIGSMRAKIGSFSEIKDPLKLLLPVGSVLVLQGNSANIAIHAISAMSEKCCHIILGKRTAKEESRSVSPATNKPTYSASSSEREASDSPGVEVADSSGRTQVPLKLQNVGAASRVLPIRLTVPSGQTPSEVHTPSLQPLFPATAAHPVGSFSPVAVLVPGWSPMPRIVRTASAGTGVFLPSNTSPSGPGRPPYTTLQRRQGILSPPSSMQRTASSPAFFPSSNADFYQASSSISPTLFQPNSQQSTGTLQPPEAASNPFILPSPPRKIPMSESSIVVQSTDSSSSSKA